MPLFGRRRDKEWVSPGQVSSPSPVSTALPQGWEPVPGQPLPQDLANAVHEITRVMYGHPRSMPEYVGIGGTTFADAYRTSIDGRTVIVANARTVIEPGLFQAGKGTPTVAVCAVELPTVLPIICIQPRRYRGLLSVGEIKTGNPAFDDYYQVIGVAGLLAKVSGVNHSQDVLTPELQERVMAHDDWVFRAERYQFACVSKGAFRSAEEISVRVGEVMNIIAAIPTSVMPDRVDRSTDDLVARISQLNSVEDAIAFLQQLTPADRERLARSDTPLAAFADVRTPEEAIARLQSLDPRLRMQVIAMFMRVEDGQ